MLSQIISLAWKGGIYIQMLLVWTVSQLGFFILVALLEEPHFYISGLVSALNSDSLSLNWVLPGAAHGGSGDAGGGERVQGCPRQEE